MNRDPIKEKTMLKKIFSYQIVLCVFSTLAFAVEMDTSYSVKWTNTPWGGGGLIPAGPPWNMVGPFDFDGDGFGDLSFRAPMQVNFVMVSITMRLQAMTH